MIIEKRLVWCILSVMCLSASVAQGLIVDTIEVTTTQIPLKINETGRSITVLESNQIIGLPANSLDEILQTITGVEVQSRGGFGVQGDILMRGSTFTQVLILLDGMRMNDPLTGHFNSYIPVTKAEITRIEVLRGSAAAMYGADAVGGVINIITKSFSSNQSGNEISGALNYGSHKLVSGYQGFSITNGNSTFGGGFSLNQSEGEFFPEKVIDTTLTLDDYNNYFDIKTISASYSHVFGNGLRMSARSAFDYRDFGARYFYTTSTFDKSRETVANWWNQLKFEKVTNKGATDFNLAYKYNTDEFIFSPDFPSTNNHTSQFINATINHLRSFNDLLILKIGVQADNRSIESNDRGDHSDFHIGAYVMGVYRSNGLNVTASLRGDHDQNYGFEISPQLNASYVLPKIVLRASAGRSIRAGDYTERYVSNNLLNLTPGRSLGNPNLIAENSWSEEIGIDYNISNSLSISATAFARQSSNLIDFVSTNQSEIGIISEIGSLVPEADYFFASNITDINTIGLELESDFRHKLGDEASLLWNVGYTYISTTNEEDIVSVYISSHARQLLTTRLLLDFYRFDVSFSGLYKERSRRIAQSISSTLSPSYILCNIGLGYYITESLGFNFQVQNVLDESYQNILGAEMPGRWLMGGLRYRI